VVQRQTDLAYEAGGTAGCEDAVGCPKPLATIDLDRHTIVILMNMTCRAGVTDLGSGLLSERSVETRPIEQRDALLA
jgi:hypothetical protein